MFQFLRDTNASFLIPPSPEPDRDWALVPGNYTDVKPSPIAKPLWVPPAQYFVVMGAIAHNYGWRAAKLDGCRGPL